MNGTIATILTIVLLVISAKAQNPPETDDPDASRGNPKSPDGAYEWVVRADTSIRYELIDHSNRQKIMTVSAYYPDVDSANIRYARASGFFWNQDGTIVALDELNRRRAGRLYFFTLRSGNVHEILSENIVPIPATADEGRVVVDPGWISPTRIRVRLALKARTGDTTSRYYIIDFSDPDRPLVQSTP